MYLKLFIIFAYTVIYHILRSSSLRSSFSKGIACLLAVSCALASLDGLLLTRNKINILPWLFQGTNIHNLDIFKKERHPVDEFAYALILGMIYSMLALYPIIRLVRVVNNKLKPRNNNETYTLSLIFFAMLCGIVFFLISPWMYLYTQKEPFSWTLDYILSDELRMQGFTYLFGTLVTFGLFVPVSFKGVLMNMSVHVRRKYFHMIAIMMFLPIIYFDVPFKLRVY
jgi:hypothetical protein